MKKYYFENIEEATLENNNFRKVAFTGPHSQVVLMSLLPGEDIGNEVHHVDQFFRIEGGEGKAIVDGEEFGVSDGSAVLVPEGLEHNFINTGDTPLKLYTIYSPVNHIDGRVHATKADALADTEDEEFGHK